MQGMQHFSPGAMLNISMPSPPPTRPRQIKSKVLEPSKWLGRIKSPAEMGNSNGID